MVTIVSTVTARLKDTTAHMEIPQYLTLTMVLQTTAVAAEED